MTRPVDIGELEAVANRFARVAASLGHLAQVYGGVIDDLRAEQRQLRDDLGALSNRLESLTRMVGDRTDHLV